MPTISKTIQQACSTCKHWQQYEFGYIYVCNSKRFEFLSRIVSKDKDFNFGCICHEVKDEEN